MKRSFLLITCRAIFGAVTLIAMAGTGCTVVRGGPAAGERIYVANMESHTVSVVDGGTLAPVTTIEAKGELTHDLFLTPDGRKLFATNMRTGTISVIDATTNAVIATIPTGKSTHAIAVSPDGKELWINAGDERQMPIVDVANHQVKGAVPLGEPIGNGHIWFSPDGKRAYATSPKHSQVLVIDTAARQIVARVDVGAGPTFILVNGDGRRVWGTNTGGDSVYAIDPGANKVLATVEVGKGPNHLAIVDRELYVTVGGTNEVVVIGDVGDRLEIVKRIPVGTRPHGIWPSTDGRRLYVAHEGTNDLRVIDAATKTVVGTVPVGRRPIAVVSVR